MHTWLIDLLECPACHGTLEWEVSDGSQSRIEAGAATCRECPAVYPIGDGIGLFLLPDPQRRDLWQEVDNRLLQYLQEHPNVRRELMETPLEELGPADLFYRALVLEAQGEFKQARELEDLATAGIYTEEYRACLRSQMEYVIEQLAGTEAPIVDLASGRGSLVERMLGSLDADRRIVATDFSLPVLRRDRAWLRTMGWYDQVSLLAVDARHTPFRAGSVELLTTNLGLQNIDGLGIVLRELRRIVRGRFLAVSHFYPEEDDANSRAIGERGLLSCFRREALAGLGEAGWQAKLANVCHGLARPTPVSDVLDGAGIDGFPVIETILEWCVIDAT
jgi:uncharacterized protein YbaR (Trm112 family)